MRYINCDLPAYPVAEDMWDALASEKRPIVVYGMGNGADKLIERFAKYGITISDFFASDGFVRGHTFHGMRVKSFSEIRETYSDFVIVLSFASNRAEVIDMLTAIDEAHEMYVPDMPVAGEEYFDREFYNTHYGEILEAYSHLSDEDSKNAYANIINYKLTGKMRYIMDAYSTKEELYSELSEREVRAYVDAGAYNGDTAKEAIEYFPSLREIIAIEPDPKNYKKLVKFKDSLASPEIRTVNAAVWSDVGGGEFLASGNRNSSVSSTASYQHKDTEIELVSIDSLKVSPDYIKYDVEGAELEALIGSKNTIIANKPTMLVSLYHRSRDIFEIPGYIGREYPFYKMKLRRLRCVPAWEINLLLFNA
jgi:FkbM family methyltransferase